jgi:pimeloyl-ACP methyl ester carboxylesterase
MPDAPSVKLSRRHLLTWIASGVGVVAGASIGVLELVDHGVLPGKYALDQLIGACSVPAPSLSFAPLGPTVSGQFHSHFRQRTVKYTIGYPPGTHQGDEMSLIVMLHGYGGNHRNALVGMTPAQAVALKTTNSSPGVPCALVTVDGGNGYWNPHPNDDPMQMVVNELIPHCRVLGLGRAPRRIGLMGISMGAYGALAIAERNPGLASAVAAISPAIWTSYDQARQANSGAFASASAFDDGNVIAHVNSLNDVAVRVASSQDDPFLPGVETFTKVLPSGATVVISSGCHSDSFFLEQEPPSLQFLARHLA